MAYTRGESVTFGVGVEDPSLRGVFVAPQDYVRAREPINIQPQVERVTIQEAIGSGVDSHEQVVTKTMLAGEANINLRYRTIGYFLKSLLGGVSSAVESGETGNGVYRHTFTLDKNVTQPSLSLALARGGTLTDKEIVGLIVNSLSLDFPLDEVVNGTVNFMARSESNAQSSFTPAFSNDDYIAPHQMVTIKEATNVAGLSGANAFNVTEAGMTIDRQSSEQLAVSSVSPVDFKSGLLNLSGTFNVEKESDKFYDYHNNNTKRALQINVINTGVTIGTSSNPTLTITIPEVTFNVNESRPIDDVLVDEVEWRGSYNETEAKAITVSLVNEKADYANA